MGNCDRISAQTMQADIEQHFVYISQSTETASYVTQAARCQEKKKLHWKKTWCAKHSYNLIQAWHGLCLSKSKVPNLVRGIMLGLLPMC